jgi:hypothetical protein
LVKELLQISGTNDLVTHPLGSSTTLLPISTSALLQNNDYINL